MSAEPAGFDFDVALPSRGHKLLVHCLAMLRRRRPNEARTAAFAAVA